MSPDGQRIEKTGTNDGHQFDVNLMCPGTDWPGQEDRQEFYLPVHGFVWFYPDELEIIDHPAFQRLAGMHQLGLAYLIYRGATHKRFEHVLGVVSVVQRMVDAANHNSRKRRRVQPDAKDTWVLARPLTAVEERFIRLAALLHDIGHVPFGHTFEDELHLLNKHDEEPRLNLVLKKTQWPGAEDALESLGEVIDRLYKRYLPGPVLGRYKPSDLVKRIISHNAAAGLAEAGMRVEVCSDIVGNTICGDLLDYLYRDWYHLGKDKHFDERLLQYMEIRTPVSNAEVLRDGFPAPTPTDAFVVCIGNRPKLRTDGISGILELLESRYQLAEAVLFHRTKMTATGMLERALSLAAPCFSSGLEEWLINHPEDALLPALAEGYGLVRPEELSPETRAGWQRAKILAAKLMRRNLYDCILMLTYDEFEGRDADRVQELYGDGKDAPGNRAKALALLEKDFGLPVGSLAMYCPEKRMNKKIAEVRIFVEGCVDRFETYEREHGDPLSAGHLTAQLARFKRLWRVGFYMDPKVKQEKGPEFVRQLKEAIRVLVLGKYPRDESVPALSARIAGDVVCVPSFHLCNHTPVALLPDAADPVGGPVEDVYPTGARCLLAFIGERTVQNGVGVEPASDQSTEASEPGMQPVTQEAVPAEAAQGLSDDVPQITLEEAKVAFGTYVERSVTPGKQGQVWRHVRRRLKDVNTQGPARIKGVRAAMLDLKLDLPPKEELFSNRFEPDVITGQLDREVFKA